MRLKHIKGAKEIISKSPYLIENPKEYKGKWNKLFNNDNAIYIEIGTGKGKFITSLAIKNPNINYIGIEKFDSPLVMATKKVEDLNLKNLKFICFDASNIDEVFDKEIDKIYLTFSDPWPKKRHTKRRLTSPLFLEKYDNIFKNVNTIEMKTDNDDFFEYSLVSLEEYGYKVIEVDNDFDDEIKTEYEEKFRSLGKNINHLIVKK